MTKNIIFPGNMTFTLPKHRHPSHIGWFEYLYKHAWYRSKLHSLFPVENILLSCSPEHILSIYQSRRKYCIQILEGILSRSLLSWHKDCQLEGYFHHQTEFPCKSYKYPLSHIPMPALQYRQYSALQSWLITLKILAFTWERVAYNFSDDSPDEKFS